MIVGHFTVSTTWGLALNQIAGVPPIRSVAEVVQAQIGTWHEVPSPISNLAYK